ncbi:YqzL family protein [Paenibacillus swuensis]|nr:YqzL family protein [Paenibacillus swuensis]
MRDFSWNVFANTGDVEAYMLYRDWDNRGQNEANEHEEEHQEEWAESLN